MKSRQDGHGLTLARALGVGPGEVVSLVGGGGKTSTMFRLARELSSEGGRVVVTTTTHIYAPGPTDCPALVLGESLKELLAKTRTALSAHGIVGVGRAVRDDGRLAGIGPAWVDLLRAELPGPSFLVEADGSKCRPFKAPADHEPVIPSSTNLVVPVAGLSALGRSLDNENVHRPERVAELAGVELGSTITPKLIAAVLTHPEGGLRGVPPQARVVPLLNQADDDQRLESGRQLARELLRRGCRRVVIAALREPGATAVREVVVAADSDRNNQKFASRSQVSVVVLAAGESRRMGRLKLGLLLEGKSLLRRVVETALASSAAEVLIVLGHKATELEGELPTDSRLRVIYNRDYAEGQSSSIKAGITAVHPESEAVVFLLGDQPLITVEAIEKLIEAFCAGKGRLLQVSYRGRRSHPVLFGRSLFPELLAVTGDQGGREVLARHHAEVATVDLDLDYPEDIDTPEDYERLTGKLANRQ
jgi:molybdenum cofactor cytidylyltransferase